MKIKSIVFSVIVISAQAQAQDVWINDNSIPGIQMAMVVNAQRSVAGVVCNLGTQSCDAYVATATSCEEDALYPMMINSPLGAYPITGKCLTLGKHQVLVIVEYASAIQAYQSGGEIGFALPMASGAFKVFRFSTAGATAAIEAARTAPEPKQKPTSRRSEEML
jgi:hypothetical protein